MEKSIETIWTQGFLKSDALIAPKLNNLYSRKSLHVVEKLKRMFGINHYYIIGLALFHLVGSFFLGVPYIGMFLFSLFVVLIMISKNQMQKMRAIDQNTSSYQYLKTFDEWLKGSLSTYTLFYRFFYPLYFLGLILAMALSSFFGKLDNTLLERIMNNPDTYIVNGLPVLWILPVVIFLAISAYFGGELFKLDLNIVYGRILKKLDELLGDMEELRSG